MYIARRKNDESKKRKTIRYLFSTAKGWKNLKLFIILNDQQQHPSMMKNNVTTEKFPSGFTKPDKPHNIRIPCFLTLTGKRNEAKKKKKRRTRRKERVYVAQQCLSSPIVSSFSLSLFHPFYKIPPLQNAITILRTKRMVTRLRGIFEIPRRGGSFLLSSPPFRSRFLVKRRGIIRST